MDLSLGLARPSVAERRRWGWRAVPAKRAGDLRLHHFWLPTALTWIVTPLYRGGAVNWVALFAVWALFLTLYTQAHTARHRYPLALLGLFLLGTAYVPFNPEAAGVFSFTAAALASRSQSLKVVGTYLAWTMLVLFCETRLFHLNPWTWIGGGGGAVLLASYVLVEGKQREAEAKLRLAREEIARLAKLGERERITRDLHDVLGHTLSLITLKCQLAQRLVSREISAAGKQEIAEIETIARNALDKVRETIHGYRSVRFHDELKEMTAALELSGVTLTILVESLELSMTEECALAMVLQEATTNIIRHSFAKRCVVELYAREDKLHLVVQDDGRGFQRAEGFGIRGMRERMQALGGRLDLSSKDGTCLHASMQRQ